MLIGIDGNEANIKERVGVNVWAFEMLKGLQRTENREQRTERHNEITFQIYLSRPPLSDMPVETDNWKYRVIGPGKFWTRWRLPLDLYFHQPQPDVFLSLSHYAPRWSSIPRIVCIMDLSFLKYPEAFKPSVLWQLKNWTGESVKNASHIITISEFNKKEIIRNYGIPEDKIMVVYPGVSETFKGRTLDSQGPTLRGKKYFLFVGTQQPKKNLGRLIEAFKIVRKRFPEIELVIAGKVWEQFIDEREEGRGKREEGIRYLGYVSNEDLPGLYAGAEALVLPSLYEGFGIPAVEAMSIGTPVLASNVASLPEVTGDHAASFASRRAGAGILFDPMDVKDMAEKIEMVLSMSQNKRQELIKKGMIRARRFSWDIAVGKIIKVLYER